MHTYEVSKEFAEAKTFLSRRPGNRGEGEKLDQMQAQQQRLSFLTINLKS